MKLRLITNDKRKAEEQKKLQAAREELGKRLEAFTPVMDRIFIDFGIPLEYAVKNWQSFVLGLDQLLVENWEAEPETEDG